MNVTAKVLNEVKNATEFPVRISNSKEFPIVEETPLIIQALEGDGYKVNTFVDYSNQTFGLVINK